MCLKCIDSLLHKQDMKKKLMGSLKSVQITLPKRADEKTPLDIISLGKSELT